MRLAILVNPVAGRGKAWRRLERHLRNWTHSDWEPEVHLTKRPGHAGLIVRELLHRPPDLLAVCGGDGTMNEIVSEVPEPPFPVAILPAGTANVLARELGMPLHPVRALEQALRGRRRRADLGRLEAAHSRSFLLMAGIGFDAYVVRKCSTRLKNIAGIAAYYQAVLRSASSYTFPEFEVTTGPEQFVGVSCIIANAEGYGGGLVLTPGANMWDGMLDTLVLERRSRLQLLRFLVGARFGKSRAGDLPGVRRARSAEVQVGGAREVWVQADGELVGQLPLQARVIPSVVPLVCGAGGESP